MKINKYRDDLTVREGGKVEMNVAQVGGLLKIVNADFGGALYFLIWLRGWKTWAMIGLIAVGVLAWGAHVMACPTAVIEVRGVVAESGARP